MNINKEISRLINYGIRKSLIEEQDIVYVVNRLLAILKLNEFDFIEVDEDLNEPSNILNNILDYCHKNDILKDNNITFKDILDSNIMDTLLKRPSVIINDFYRDYSIDKSLATNNYYKLAKDSNYIRTSRIDKNIIWKTTTNYGEFILTINKSKPEKSLKLTTNDEQISNYPKCNLCKENIGYYGRINHPSKANLRVIPLKLNGEEWFMQYSPYTYFNEHLIVINDKHTKMVIDKNTFKRLLSFVELFPHYFLGSNAGLPIVGGSILTHEHYQGGNFTFPLEDAKVLREYKINGVTLEMLKWPISVIRLRGEKPELIELASHILTRWKNYSNFDLGIINQTTEDHNAITPIARFKNGMFELDLALRNNLTNSKHPFGLFNPKVNKHHIKKENIGLIEVLGLAVLPSRLDRELSMLSECLLNNVDINKYKELDKHKEFFYKLKEKYIFNRNNIEDILKREVGNIFSSSLEDCGVFKQDSTGISAFNSFIESL